jgi:membrane protease YdiL (CAAX protease family)
VARAVSPPAAAWRRAFLALAVAAWAVAFLVLRRAGTWITFAVAGPALAALASLLDPPPRALLRRPLARAALGAIVGLVMIAATHAAFSALAARWPETRAATARLFALLEAPGFAPASRGGLIAVIAACEEIVFRGALAGSAPAPARDPPSLAGAVSGRDAARIVLLSAAYASPTLMLGSGLLVACAFICGLVWGWLRISTRSLAAPILAHVVWDLGVLIWWPLVS